MLTYAKLREAERQLWLSLFQVRQHWLSLSDKRHATASFCILFWRTFPSLTSATPPPALMPQPLGVFAAPPVTLQKIGGGEIKKRKKYRNSFRVLAGPPCQSAKKRKGRKKKSTKHAFRVFAGLVST
jgi:hypothetical protein